MNALNVFRFIVQSVRLVLLPYPVAFFLSISALDIVDRILRPDLADFETGEAGEFIGGIFMSIFVVALQLVVGAPSLLALDLAKRGVRSFLAVAILSAVILSLLLAGMLQAPQFGETVGWMFPRVLLFLGPAIVSSYLLALLLRKRP